MKTVGTHGLTCLDNDDYAGIALWMQCLAEQVDALAVEQSSISQFMIDRPTIVVENEPPNIQVPTGATASNIFTRTIFNNTTFMELRTEPSDGSTYIGIGSELGSPVTVPYPKGMYLVGCGIRLVTIIAPFTYRQIVVAVDDMSVPPSGELVEMFTDTVWEPNTPVTVRLNTKGSFIINGTEGVRVSHTFSHGSAGTVDIESIGTRMWVTYVGPLDLVEVP